MVFTEILAVIHSKIIIEAIKILAVNSSNNASDQ